MNTNIPKVKFFAVMETYPNDEIALRQEICVFDNKDVGLMCNCSDEIDAGKIWNELKSPSIVCGAILEQFQKEVAKKQKGGK